MRRAILIVAVLFFTVFALGGLALWKSVTSSTAALDDLVRLHKVGILREKLLLEVQGVQSQLKTRNTRFFRGPESVIQSVKHMERVAEECLGCHHRPASQKKLEALVDHIYRFEGAISRILTIRANADRLAREEDTAYMVGASLVDELNEIIAYTSAKLEKRTREAVESIRLTHGMLFVLLAGGPILALLLGLLLLRWLGEPMKVLLEGTRRLKGGDLDHRVRGLKHEFRELGESFNEMAQSLKDQMVRMQHAEQLAVCGQMAAGLAHEIKNPLAGIKITLQLLGEEVDLPEEDRALLAKATDEIGRIDLLMRNLLDFARPRTPEFGTADVNRILRQAVDLSSRHVAVRNQGAVRLELQLDEGLPSTFADPSQLHQVFLNLILNAIEAMPEGGTVSAETSRQDGKVVVRICDTGPGVDPGVGDRIFEPFYTQKKKGTGLGLAISRRLVEQHRGSIRVSNGAEGGACFTVELPVQESGEGSGS